jgi:hypothetical protein
MSKGSISKKKNPAPGKGIRNKEEEEEGKINERVRAFKIFMV